MVIPVYYKVFNYRLERYTAQLKIVNNSKLDCTGFTLQDTPLKMTIEHIDPKSYEKLYTYFQDGGDFSVAFVFTLLTYSYLFVTLDIYIL